MMRVFEDAPDFAHQDRQAFRFRHRLAEHPALKMNNLTAMIPTLPENQVYFSARRMEQGENFDKAITDHRKEHSIEQVIEGIRTSNAYIMVREPEKHPSFHELHRELSADIEHSIRRRGFGNRALEPRSYLFISSPNSVTPFHFDRASNFLMQIEGTKEVTIFPPLDSRVITDEEYEGHISRNGQEVEWKPEAAPLGKTFHCQPGDALHIPFVAGHTVKNGPGLSITLSVFFNHRRSMAQMNALLMNKRLRPLLGRLGMQPTKVGHHHRLDSTKSFVYRGLRKAGVVGAGAQAHFLTGDLLELSMAVPL